MLAFAGRDFKAGGRRERLDTPHWTD